MGGILLHFNLYGYGIIQSHTQVQNEELISLLPMFSSFMFEFVFKGCLEHSLQPMPVHRKPIIEAANHIVNYALTGISIFNSLQTMY